MLHVPALLRGTRPAGHSLCEYVPGPGWLYAAERQSPSSNDRSFHTLVF
jgi:hypothetical protein